MGYSIKNGYVYDETSDCEGNEITNVLVSVEEDRENVLGVGRITYIDIEVENEDEEAVRCMQADMVNALAEEEFFIEDEKWREKVKQAVCNKYELSKNIINVE